MQLTIQSPSFFRQQLVTLKPVFKVLIACEDAAACDRARKLRDQLRTLCDGKTIISGFFWSFALFQVESLREQAVFEASEADMIVISLSSRDELPSDIKEWVDEWPARRPGSQAALVALLDAETKECAVESPQIGYLREIAENRGFDFFCNRDGRKGQDLFELADNDQRGQSMPWPNLIREPSPWRNWGINE